MCVCVCVCVCIPQVLSHFCTYIMYNTSKKQFMLTDICSYSGGRRPAQREEANEQDPYVVATVKSTAGHRTKVVGHVPRRISAALSAYRQH